MGADEERLRGEPHFKGGSRGIKKLFTRCPNKELTSRSQNHFPVPCSIVRYAAFEVLLYLPVFPQLAKNRAFFAAFAFFLPLLTAFFLGHGDAGLGVI